MRDTAEDWKLISQTNPYWGVLTAEEYKTENLTSDTLNEFYATGETYIAQLYGEIEHYFGPFNPKRAIDFGCGVGRLLAPIARRGPFAIGIDVAPEMCNIASKYLTSIGLTQFETSTNLPAEPVDWVNSYIVFQHIPPRIGYAILGKLWKLLNPGGVISLHLPAFREKGTLPRFVETTETACFDGDSLEILRESPATPGEVSMFDYNLNKFLAIISGNTGEIHLRSENHAGHLSVNILARKAS